jgi:carboxymethylenebutenolidase
MWSTRFPMRRCWLTSTPVSPGPLPTAATSARLGITGFCWGGRITWLYAAHNPQVKAGVAWYGRIVGQASELTPKQPIDIAGSLHGPVLGLYGGADPGIPPETVRADAPGARRLRQPREQGIIDSRVYEQAPHAFHADYRPSYRKEEAEDGWRRLQAWMKQHGV